MPEITRVEYRWLVCAQRGSNKFYEIEARDFADGSVSLLARYGRVTSSHQGGGTVREIDLRGRDLMKEFARLVRSKRKRGYKETSAIHGKVSAIDGRGMPAQRPGGECGKRVSGSSSTIVERMQGRNERALFF